MEKSEYTREQLKNLVWGNAKRTRKTMVNGRRMLMEVSPLGYASMVALDSLSDEELKARAGIGGETATIGYFFLT